METLSVFLTILHTSNILAFSVPKTTEPFLLSEGKTPSFQIGSKILKLPDENKRKSKIFFEDQIAKKEKYPDLDTTAGESRINNVFLRRPRHHFPSIDTLQTRIRFPTRPTKSNKIIFRRNIGKNAKEIIIDRNNPSSNENNFFTNTARIEMNIHTHRNILPNNFNKINLDENNEHLLQPTNDDKNTKSVNSNNADNTRLKSSNSSLPAETKNINNQNSNPISPINSPINRGSLILRQDKFGRLEPKDILKTIINEKTNEGNNLNLDAQDFKTNVSPFNEGDDTKSENFQENIFPNTIPPNNLHLQNKNVQLNPNFLNDESKPTPVTRTTESDPNLENIKFQSPQQVGFVQDSFSPENSMTFTRLNAMNRLNSVEDDDTTSTENKSFEDIQFTSNEFINLKDAQKFDEDLDDDQSIDNVFDGITDSGENFSIENTNSFQNIISTTRNHFNKDFNGEISDVRASVEDIFDENNNILQNISDDVDFDINSIEIFSNEDNKESALFIEVDNDSTEHDDENSSKFNNKDDTSSEENIIPVNQNITSKFLNDRTDQLDINSSPDIKLSFTNGLSQQPNIFPSFSSIENNNDIKMLTEINQGFGAKIIFPQTSDVYKTSSSLIPQYASESAINDCTSVSTVISVTVKHEVFTVYEEKEITTFFTVTSTINATDIIPDLLIQTSYSTTVVQPVTNTVLDVMTVIETTTPPGINQTVTDTSIVTQTQIRTIIHTLPSLLVNTVTSNILDLQTTTVYDDIMETVIESSPVVYDPDDGTFTTINPSELDEYLKPRRIEITTTRTEFQEVTETVLLTETLARETSTIVVDVDMTTTITSTSLTTTTAKAIETTPVNDIVVTETFTPPCPDKDTKVFPHPQIPYGTYEYYYKNHIYNLHFYKESDFTSWISSFVTPGFNVKDFTLSSNGLPKTLNEFSSRIN